MQKFIRNFSIIAHIDHGKSTLADRLIEYCGALESREMQSQVLDSMDIEKERGITIKAQTVRLSYKAKDGNNYFLNLMDTPGHVDFGYEVSRCLAACEGALLVVDASQGVEAQTLENVYKALDANLVIIPVLNKIDLPAADVEKTKEQIEEVIGIDASDSLLISAKSGIGIEDLLEAIVHRLPPPSQRGADNSEDKEKLKALLVDSWYDQYLGVVILLRIFSGKLSKGTKIKMMSNNASYQVERVGYFTPKKYLTEALLEGEIGFFTASIKRVADCKIGDTITEEKNPCLNALSGFKANLPVVFCSLYPADASDFEKLKESLAKLNLNDASFSFELENSAALGFGYRCGFLGLLHLEVTEERLMRQFDLDIIATAPSVVYRITLNDGKLLEIHNPADFPAIQQIASIEEPWIKASVITPPEYLGVVLNLCTAKRGVQISMNYITNRVMLVYNLPLNEVVYDFYDKLKSISRGYASVDWHFDNYREGDLIKLTIMVNAEVVDALSLIVHRSQAETRGRAICEKLKDLIPRQLFQVAIQAAVGGRIIARETVKAMRKDVLAKCYGGDITRKRKLLEKQKAGKKRMRNIGNVEIPHSAFISVLKIDN